MKSRISKKLIVTIAAIFIFSLSGIFAQAKTVEVKWHTNLEEAQKIAKKESKNIFVQFTGSDWCIWCKRLEGEVLKTDEFKKYAKKNLVLVKLDFPKSIKQTDEQKKYNYGLAKKYGIRGFPTVILLNSSGKTVSQTGYVKGGPRNYVKHLKDLFAKK